jgi:hypothetical protein
MMCAQINLSIVWKSNLCCTLKKRYLHVLLMFSDHNSRIYMRGRGFGDPAGSAWGRGWYEDVPREHWRGRGRGILLPAGAGMESYSPARNSPLPSLVTRNSCFYTSKHTNKCVGTQDRHTQVYISMQIQMFMVWVLADNRIHLSFFIVWL